MSEPIPQKYTLVYLTVGIALLVILLTILFFRKRLSVERIKRAPSSDLTKFKLTAREIEIMGLLAAGLSTAQIAHNLFISEKTVRVHISNMIAKTNSDSRVDLILLAKQEPSSRSG